MSKENTNVNEKVLISKTMRNGIIVVLAVFLIAVLTGFLSAFESGQFRKTFDLVLVDKPLSEIDFNDSIFESRDSNSKDVFETKQTIVFDEELGENVIVETLYYRGYFTKFFYESEWFYLDSSFNLLLVFIFYIAIVNFMISKKKDKDEIYQELSLQINTMVIKENITPAISFEPFVEDWNNIRKKKQYINNIKYELAELERKTKLEVRKVFFSKNDKDILVFKKPDKKLTKKEKKYFQKKEQLNFRLSPEYVEENALFENVENFKYVHPSFINTGANSNSKTTDEYSSIKSEGEIRGFDLLKKFLLSITLVLLFGVVVSFSLFRTKDDWLLIMFGILLKMLPLLLQIFLAFSYSNHFVEKKLIPDLKLRINIINLYLNNKHKYIVKEVN